LVGGTAGVAGVDRRDRVVGLPAFAPGDRGERTVGPVPALIPVHGVVAAGDRGDSVGGQLGEVAHRRVGRDVAAVRERMDPRLLGREPEQRAEMVDVGMDAAVGHETEQVHLLSPLEGRDERRVVEERAVLDGLVDPHQVLVEHPAGADRQVAHLGVAHLSRWEAYGLAGRIERRVRTLGPEPVEDGRLRLRDGISRAGGRAAPAVEDDEDYRTAARQIAANESGSREAPPTSASSTDLMNACASWAISGVAVLPVPIAQTGSYAITSSGCGSSAETWRRRTASVSPASRSDSSSPTQAITRSPAARAAAARRAVVSSVSPKYCRRSEWPTSE